ncbi:ATP-binding protein [Streptomyces boninensis]|uniref:ATP-binding protein n=1 Tax=Streptomyces boninensis TaxID=2039455 RepID=UPI003B215186
MTGTGIWRAGNLPAETSSFIGRRDEVDDLAALLPRVRMVTLAGAGGVGKTRLALRAANAAAAAFPDGVWLAELSPLRDPALLAVELERVLGVADRSVRPAADVLAEALRDKRLLLVLDSCEHLVPACAELVVDLLRAAPGLHLLATSRQPLGIPAERRIEVAPLPADGTESEAAHLFHTRARHGQDEAPAVPLPRGHAVAEIVRRLEGIPLAIELAAARLRTGGMTAGELAERLGTRFEPLALDDRRGGHAPRHQALRTAIGWSHELCTPAERLLWARLSVFAGGFDTRAAVRVCAGGPIAAERVPATLDALAAKSVIRREEPGDRYRILETVREYGAYWLRELGEEHVVRRRHRDHYLRLAQQADVEWMGPGQVDWHRLVVIESANIRGALDFCLDGPDARAALQIAGALWFHWFACGHAREGRHYLGEALGRTAISSGPGAGLSAGLSAEPDPVRAKALWACALAAIAQGDLMAAPQLAAAFRAAVDDSPGAQAAAAHLDGAIHSLTGDQEAARAVLEAGPDPALRYGGDYPAGWYLVQTARAFVHVHRSEYEAAVRVSRRLRDEAAARGEVWCRAWADYMIALAELGRGDTAAAAAHARTALDGKWRLHDSLGSAMTVDVLAQAAARPGSACDGRRAARLLGAGDRIWHTLGVPQMGMPELIAARAACEKQALAAAGETAFHEAYEEGLTMRPEDAVAYAREGDDHGSDQARKGP